MSELEKNESSEILNSDQLLKETIFVENPLIFEITNSIKEDTAHIEMGGTTAKNLSACSECLKFIGIETEDPSKALDICTLRVLKLLPGIKIISGLEGKNYAEFVFSNLVNQYILPPEKEYLRIKEPHGDTFPPTTIDQIMRQTGAAVNIQRHITEAEMRKVFVYVRDIFSIYSSRYNQL